MAETFKNYCRTIAVCLAAGVNLWACSNENSLAEGAGTTMSKSKNTTPDNDSGTDSNTGSGPEMMSASLGSGTEFASKFRSIFVKNCIRCHDSMGSFDPSSFEKIKASRTTIISHIEGRLSIMPPAPAAEWTRTEKTLVLQYLKTSNDFK